MIKRVGLVVNKGWNMYNFRKGLIKFLIENDYEVVVIAPEDEYREKIEKLGAKFVDVGMDPKGVNPIKDLKLTMDLKKIYKNEKLDIVFNYTVKPIIYGSIGARLAKIPSVAVTTGLGYGFISEGIVQRIIKVLYKCSLKFTKDVWFLNQTDMNEFHRKKIIPKTKGFVLPGEGIDLEEFKGIPSTREDGKTVFLMIGRALWDKGCSEYFQSSRDLMKKYDNLEFWFVGEIGVPNPSSIPREVLEEYVEDGSIKYLGTTTDVRDVLKECDGFVLPSYREGISRVLMEAGSMEKPLLASKVPGCEELVEDGINGFLFESRDVEGLKEALERFIELDREKRLEYGRASRRKMRDSFSLEVVCKIYLDFLREYE